MTVADRTAGGAQVVLRSAYIKLRRLKLQTMVIEAEIARNEIEILELEETITQRRQSIDASRDNLAQILGQIASAESADQEGASDG